MNNKKIIWFNRFKKPNNWILDRDENLPFPFLNLIFDNITHISANKDELKCIYCLSDVNYTEINKYCYKGSVFCPICSRNTIVPIINIPEPTLETLKNWHLLAFGMFAHRPNSISDDESEYEIE